VPRYTASFDVSDTQTILLGASGAFGPNAPGEDGRTRIYGVDGFWKWKPTNAFNGFPFVKVQGELMRRSADVAAQGLGAPVSQPSPCCPPRPLQTGAATCR
jgi:hypothetical protein